MELFYICLFTVLVVVAVFLEFNHGTLLSSGKAKPGHPEAPPGFRSFRNNYLFIYSLMMAGDWLQGPYIYALYEHYGYKVGDIGRLFIAGFGSSMVFGTIVGALADTYGRKGASLLYVVTYSLSCLTKHSPDYGVLMFGRLLGGIATSLLFSSFESWLVAEHNKRGYSEELLGDTFSKSVFLGAGLMAILSGLAGNVLVEDLRLGPTAPFDAAVVVMVLGGAVVAATWRENYGSNAHHSLLGQFKNATVAILADPKVALLGAMQAMFEASMYTFVFLWTPALTPTGEKIPHGMVFSCFMTACMAGSALSGVLLKRFKPEVYMVYVFGVSAMAMAVPFAFHLELRAADVGSSLGGDEEPPGLPLQGKVQLLAFCAFEACVGVFWPSMMAMRAVLVPEEMRSTIMNIFRIPLNLFVCLVLYKVSHFPLSVMFGLCVVLLFLCVYCQLWLDGLVRASAPLPDSAAAAGSGGEASEVKSAAAGRPLSNRPSSSGVGHGARPEPLLAAQLGGGAADDLADVLHGPANAVTSPKPKKAARQPTSGYQAQ